MSELDPETHELLRKARQGTPQLPTEVRSRVRGAVLSGAGVTTVVAGVSFAKVVVIGVVSASVASVATFAVTKRSFEQRTLAPEQVRVPDAPPVEPAPILAPAPVPETTAPAAGIPRPVAVAPRAIAPPPVPTTEPAVVDDHSLAAELETLEGILQATDAANWSEARVRLGAYFSRFEEGHLRTEARALEVLTLCGEHHEEAPDACARSC